jgi:hypothetical protein
MALTLSLSTAVHCSYCCADSLFLRADDQAISTLSNAICVLELHKTSSVGSRIYTFVLQAHGYAVPLESTHYASNEGFVNGIKSRYRPVKAGTQAVCDSGAIHFVHRPFIV